jgi:ABC-type dipeptide/oligopeptide/nickel transport system permease component
MTDTVIALIIFAPFIIMLIGGVINVVGEIRRNKRIEKVAEYVLGVGSLIGLVWVALFLFIGLPEISKVHRESRELRESFRSK